MNAVNHASVWAKSCYPYIVEKVLEEIPMGHTGILKSVARILVWWPEIDVDVEETVSRCTQCQENSKYPAKAPVHHSREPWTRIHIDFADHLKDPESMWFIVVDAHTKCP